MSSKKYNKKGNRTFSKSLKHDKQRRRTGTNRTFRRYKKMIGGTEEDEDDVFNSKKENYKRIKAEAVKDGYKYVHGQLIRTEKTGSFVAASFNITSFDNDTLSFNRIDRGSDPYMRGVGPSYMSQHYDISDTGDRTDIKTFYKPSLCYSVVGSKKYSKKFFNDLNIVEYHIIKKALDEKKRREEAAAEKAREEEAAAEKAREDEEAREEAKAKKQKDEGKKNRLFVTKFDAKTIEIIGTDAVYDKNVSSSETHLAPEYVCLEDWKAFFRIMVEKREFKLWLQNFTIKNDEVTFELSYDDEKTFKTFLDDKNDPFFIKGLKTRANGKNCDFKIKKNIDYAECLEVATRLGKDINKFYNTIYIKYALYGSWFLDHLVVEQFEKPKRGLFNLF